MIFTPEKIKKYFPILQNKNIIYLDSSAKALTLKSVIEKEKEYYENYGVNVFRGIYKLSEKATKEYENVREMTAKMLNAKKEEIVFTTGTTESINMVANYIENIIKKDEEIVVSIAEHHSNFVPWQAISQKTDAKLKIIDIDENGTINPDSISKYISRKTKIVALFHISNVLGSENNIRKIAKAIKNKNKNVLILLDCAQSIPHKDINVKSLGVDFIAFSAHKMGGPTGVGVLWGKYDLLLKMPPFKYGGEMIEYVTQRKTEYKLPPHKFEAGTPNIAGVIAFGESVKFRKQIGIENIYRHSKKLVKYALFQLKKHFTNDIKIIGSQNYKKRVSLISFNLKGLHPHDIASILAEENICVRAGHHCCQPLHEKLGLPASLRISFYVYNTKKDIDKFINSLQKAVKKLK